MIFWIERLFSWLSKPPHETKPTAQDRVDEPAEVFNGWLTFAARVEMHHTWRYSQLDTPGSRPQAVVAHYTATNPGTGMNMAKRRLEPFKKGDRAASWHVTIETDGTVIQMAPLTAGCWHALGYIKGVGAPNRTAIGIELVGHGKEFPEAQVAAACRVWRAIVQAYGIKREHAMVQHSALDPKRRGDPGPVWMKWHAPRVLDEACR